MANISRSIKRNGKHVKEESFKYGNFTPGKPTHLEKILLEDNEPKNIIALANFFSTGKYRKII